MMHCNIGRGLLVKKIVIVGGGAAGLELAIKLGRSIGKKKIAEILLLDKERILGISKCDMLDEELTNEIKKTLPKKIEHIFFSSIAEKGLSKLKDKIWSQLNF